MPKQENDKKRSNQPASPSTETNKPIRNATNTITLIIYLFAVIASIQQIAMNQT